MNKKGFLLAEETLKIIIALISISFLVLFLTSLYFSNVNEKGLKQAAAILKSSDQSIEKNIANLANGESKEIQLENPNGWYLLGFFEGEGPNSCGKSCLCICDKSDIKFWKSWAADCTELGICLPVEELTPFNEKIKIISKERTSVTISKESDRISISKNS